MVAVFQWRPFLIQTEDFYTSFPILLRLSSLPAYQRCCTQARVQYVHQVYQVAVADKDLASAFYPTNRKYYRLFLGKHGIYELYTSMHSSLIPMS